MTNVPPMPTLVEVLPLAGFDQPLTYGVNESLLDALQVGSLVRIPLGVRRIMGVVSSLSPKHCPPRDKLRFVSALVQPEPVLSEELVGLAKWVSTYYASSLENTLGAMIPASVRDGMNAKTRKMIEVVSMPQPEVERLLKRSPKQLQAYALLSQQRGKKMDAVAWSKKNKVSMSVLDGLVQKVPFLLKWNYIGIN